MRRPLYLGKRLLQAGAASDKCPQLSKGAHSEGQGVPRLCQPSGRAEGERRKGLWKSCRDLIWDMEGCAAVADFCSVNKDLQGCSTRSSLRQCGVQKVFAKYQGELVGLLQAPELVHFALSANQFSSWVNKAQACRECSCNGEPWSLRIALHRFASLRGVAVLLLALGSGSAGSGFASILGA